MRHFIHSHLFVYCILVCFFVYHIHLLLLLFFRLFICSFIHSFVRSFIRSFACSSFIHSFIHSKKVPPQFLCSSGLHDQFERIPSDEANTNGINYDLSSIMHYSAYAFSRNRRPTITPRDRRISLGSLGQRDDPSQLDIQHINRLYCNQPSKHQCSFCCCSGHGHIK